MNFTVPYYYLLILLNLHILELWSLFLCLMMNFLPAAYTLPTPVSPVHWFKIQGLL